MAKTYVSEICQVLEDRFDIDDDVKSGIKEELKDKEWWVRQTAANALIDMNVSISEIEDVLSGYDKYASDAVKYALYRSIDMNEE